jgi:retron-type reverse transcriptase
MTTAQAVGAVSREAAEWYAIDWRTIHRNVRRLQVRIAQATKEGRWGRVRALQRLLTHSYSGKVLAVRRVTENNGKKTPGVDQEIWDTPEKKTQAVHALKRRGYQSQPLRRVYIPKSDGKTMRPLGIPTMKDRAQQALYLLALEPVVETTADKNSYGFRQQRSCADAMEQCFKALRSANTQWILEGDITSCFDKISHDWLLAHFPIDRVILQKWLKSGYMEKHVLHDTTDGTPQGGIVTPLTQKVISSSKGQSRVGEQGTRCLTFALRGNMFMTDDAFDQIGKGSAAERRSWPAPASCCFTRSGTALVTRIRSVRASSISVLGGSVPARSAGRSSRAYSADHVEASAEHGGTAAEVREKQWPDHWSDRDRRGERVSRCSKKAWLSRAPKAAHCKFTFPIRLIACSSQSSRRPTIFWSPRGSALSGACQGVR